MRIFLRILSLMKRYWPQLLVVFIALLLATFLYLINPWVIKLTIDRIISQKRLEILVWASLVIVLVEIFRGGFHFIQDYLLEFLSNRLVYDLRNRMYQHLQRLSFSYYDRAQTGELVSRTMSDVETIGFFLGFGMGIFFSTLILFIATVFLLARLHWRLTLLSLSFMPLIALLAYRLSNLVRPRYRKIQERIADLTSVLQETISGTRVVKAFAAEEYEIKKFGNKNRELLNENVLAAKIWASYRPLINTVAAMGMAMILWYGGYQVIRGNLTPGSFVAFLSYLLMLLWPMQAIGWIVNLLQRAVASAGRIFEILDTAPLIKEKVLTREVPFLRGHVRFENVSFGYDETLPVLKNINLEVLPGEKVALIGATGSGKSTLVSLIPRFYDVQEGRITIDRIDVRDLPLSFLRCQIGVVLQETFLFSTTIRENITYGRTNATEEEVIEAARAAGIHEEIMAFPQGYNNLVGERGITLSGGQKQRVAIARALLLNPRILILDDSTSNVDMETEYLIQQALRELMKGRTTFIIAHRLTTIQEADKIVILENGEISAIGTHEELIRNPGFYARVYQLQLQSQEGERIRQ